MPSQLLRSLLNRDENEVKDRMKSYLREGAIVGGVGYAAFKTIKGSNVINEVNNAVTSLNRDPEFNRVGRNLRQATEALGDLKKAAKTKALKAFSTVMNIDEVFSGDASKVGERRAFYASLFDVAKDDVLTDDMRAIIKQGYEGKTPLTNEQKNRITGIFESIKSNEKTLENFKRKYSVFSNARDLLDDNVGSAFERTRNQVLMESFDSLDDEKLLSSKGEMGSELSKIRERFNAIQRRAGKGAKVELVGFKEDSSKEVRSLYARVSFGGDKNLNVPLFLAKDRNGNIIYRATENLSTRYVAPLRVLNAQELFNSVDGTSVKGGNLSTSKASYSFEEYVFQRITKSFGNHNGSLANISNREIMEFYEFQRSFGLDAPRGMFDQFSKIQNASGKNFVSHAFAESMAFARSAQSSRFLIAGLESFDGKIQQDIAKRLIQFFPDQVRGAGYPIISRLQDPFDRGQELSFTDIQSSEGRNAFNALSRYGRIDEIIQEQTAREFQMFGRYEMASGVKGLDNDFRFGANNSISLFGSGELGQLIGVDKAGGKGVHGVNLASIMISGDKAKALGLGEGMSYFGGQLKVNSSITNTVYDTGIGRTKLLNELIKVSKDTGKNFLTIGVGGDYTIEEFFKNFANKDGEVIIGFKDQEAAKIVRRKGMESFTLGISEMSTEGGRSRYHITGEAVQVLDRSKMFSTILKDTTLGIDSAGIEKKLDEIAGVGRGASLLNQLFKNLNVDIKQTLLSTSDQLKKSPQYLSSQIAGSLELFGIGKDSYTKKMETLIGDDTNYLSYINKNYGNAYTTLGEIGEKTRKAAYVRASIESALSAIQGTAVGGFTQEEVIGRVLGASKEYAERFGLGPKYGTEDFDTFFTRTATTLGIANSKAALEEINKGITFTAHYVSSGGIHTDYGRNLAKVEPRFMNYLYTSLRGNFGLDEEASTKFIGSFLARQEGIEGRSKAILGMKLTSLGLTKMGKGKLDSQIGTMAGVNTLDLEDTLKLLDFGSDEEATKEFLSKNKGSIFDFKNIIKDDTRLNMIKESLGGRSEIFLPGEETFEAIRGYTVAKSGENVNIEGEFSRYITDLTQSIGGMQQSTSDEDFANHFYGFKVAKSSIAKVAGLAIRNSLTGRITGSGTYMGQGIIFGKDPAGSRAGGTEIKSNHLKGLYEALEAKKGYVMFQDAQGFLDSMSTFRQAMIDQLRFDRFEGGDEAAIAQEARRVTGERIKDFFFGMYKGEKSGVKITAQRNPNIYFAHFMPGMELMRYDFMEGENDPFLKLISANVPYNKTEFTEAGKEEIKKRKRVIQFEKLRQLYGPRFAFQSWDDFENARFDYYQRYRRLVEEKQRLQGIVGIRELEIDSEGNLVKTQRTRTIRRFNKFTGTYSETGTEVVLDKFNFNVLSETPGTSTFPKEREEYYQARREIFERIRGLRETREQARWSILGKPIETSPGSGEYKMVTRTHTISQIKLDEYASELESLKAKLQVEEGQDGALTGRERSQAESRVRTLTEKIANAKDSGKTTKAGVKLFDTKSTSRERTILQGSLLYNDEAELSNLRFTLSNIYDRDGGIAFNQRTGLIDEDYEMGKFRIEQAKKKLEEIKTGVRARRKANRKAVELAIKTAQMVVKKETDYYQENPTLKTIASDKFKSIFTGMGINEEVGVNEPKIGRPLAELRRSYQGLIKRQRKKLSTLLKKVPKSGDPLVGKEPFLLVPEDGTRPSPVKYRESLIRKDLESSREALVAGDMGRIPAASRLGTRSDMEAFSGQNDRFLFHLFSSFTTPQEVSDLEIDDFKELRYKRVIQKYNEYLLDEDPSKPKYYDIQDFLIKTKKITPIGVLLLNSDRKNTGEIKYFEGMDEADKLKYIELGVKNLELSEKSIRKEQSVPRLIYNLQDQEVFFDFTSLTKRARAERRLERHTRLQAGHFSKIEEILRGVLGLESVEEEYGKGWGNVTRGGLVYTAREGGKETVGGSKEFLVGKDPLYGEIQYTHRGITQGIISGALYNDLLDQVDDLEAQRAVISGEDPLDTAYRELGVSFGDLRLSLIGNETANNRTEIYREIEANFEFIKNNLLSPRGAYSNYSGKQFVEYLEEVVNEANEQRVVGKGAQRKINKLTKQLKGKDGTGGIVGRLKRVNEEIEKHEAERESLKEKELVIDTRKNSRSEILSRDFKPRFIKQMHSPIYAYEEKQAALLKKRESLLARRAELERLIQEQQVGRIDLDFMRSFESQITLRDSDIRPISDLRRNLKGSYGEALASFFGLNKNDQELASSGIRTVRDFIENSEYRRTAFRAEMDRRIAANEGSNALIEYVRLKGGDVNGLMNFLSNNITYREINVNDGEGGTKTIKVMSHPEIDVAQQELDTAHRENQELIERGKKNREIIRDLETRQRAEREAALNVLDQEYEAARQAEEARLAQLEAGFATNPNKEEYENALARLKKIKEEREALRNSELGTLLGEIKHGKKPLVDESDSPILDEDGNPRFFNEQYKVTSEEDRAIREAVGAIEAQGFKYDTGELIHGKNNIFLALEALHGEEIKDLRTLKTLGDTRGSENITYTFGLKDNLETRTETVNEAIDRLLLRGLSRHLSQGDVGGGIVYFPQFDVKMHLVNANGRTVGNFESRLDFSRFAIGDFDADIYQIYHDTTNVMRQRFQNNAESFHGLFNAGTEFLIHMKELSKGMDEYGKRLTGGSLTMSEFKLDQYEKERILKSVGGLDVQIKVGMLSLAHSMAEESDPDQMSAYFKRIRTGASLIAVAQESLIIKAKHLNVAADVGSEFLGAMKKSYSTGEGKYLYDFFEQNIFKGSIYEHVGMEEEIKLQNIEFTNLPDNSQTAQSLKKSLGGVSLSKRAIKDTMDIMARTVKSRGYHALGSDTQLYKKLERGDAFNMNQLMRLLSVSMEGGFTGDISEDALDEIMNAQKTMRENIAMNLGNFTKRGGGYLAAAAIGAGYLAGVKTSPEVLNSETKFSDMRAKESIGGRHLYNMTTKEHGNVSPSRFDEPLNMYNRPINMGETMVTRNSSMRMYGEAPTQADAMMAARRVVGAGGNAFLGIQDGRMPISNSYITKSIKD